MRSNVQLMGAFVLALLLSSGEFAPFAGWIGNGPTGGATLSYDWTPESKLDFTAAIAEISYFHFGGRVLFRPGQRVDPWFGLTAGISTRDSNAAFSGSAGGGVDIRISPTMSWRLDGRFYTTFGANYIAVDCGGNGLCSSSASAVIYTQFAATTGLAFRFGSPTHRLSRNR